MDSYVHDQLVALKQKIYTSHEGIRDHSMDSSEKYVNQYPQTKDYFICFTNYLIIYVINHQNTIF